jgi:hypothetical protein
MPVLYILELKRPSDCVRVSIAPYSSPKLGVGENTTTSKHCPDSVEMSIVTSFVGSTAIAFNRYPRLQQASTTGS